MATTNISNVLNNSNVPSFQNGVDSSRFGAGTDIINLQAQAGGKRILITGANSLIGHSLFEELRNDHIAIHSGDTPHKFFGTINQKECNTVPMPSSSIKELNFKLKPRTFKKQVLSSDIIILDLMNTDDLDEAEYIVKLLKNQGEEVQNQVNNQNQKEGKEQQVILVSTAMTWIRTPKKLKKNLPQKNPKDDSELEDSKSVKLREDESETEDDPSNPNNKVLYFLDKDFQSRVPSPRYQQLKTLEMLALSAQKTNRKLRVHILCAGLPYGNGEQNNVFYEFFRRAWLSLHPDLAALPIINGGANRIPTIHVLDLARCIKHLMTNKVAQQYLFAVDSSKAQTQSSIMKSISQGMGSGLVKNVDLGDIIDEEWAEFLSVDLKLKTSHVFEKAAFWHCKKGICKSTMQMLNEEFNLYRGLFPLKLFVTGPPGSGKTFYATKLSEAYGVPHIKILDLVQMGYKMQDSFGDEIRKKDEEIRTQTVEDYNKTKKKKDPELDRNLIKVKLPDDILHRLVKMQLDSAACKNKGFILDGYPRNLNDAKSIFLHKIENYQPAVQVEGEPILQQPLFPGYEVNTDLFPQYCIIFQGDDLPLKQKLKELPLDKIDGTHHNDQGMDRRLKIYREQNPNESPNSVQEFFIKVIGKENSKTTQFDKDVGKQMHELQEFIERNGKPCCLNLITDADNKFLKGLEKKGKVKAVEASHEESKSKVMDDDSDEDEVLKMIRKEEQEEQKRQDEAQIRMRQDMLDEEARRVKEAQDQQKLELIRQQERDLLDTRSQPIRQYLMDNVVPHLTEGLIDLCKKTPGDPVDYLSDFLLKRADFLDQQRIQAREAEIKAKLEAKQKRDANK